MIITARDESETEWDGRVSGLDVGDAPAIVLPCELGPSFDVPADEPVANLALARRLADRLERARLAGDSHDLRLAESLTLHVIELLESSTRAGAMQ